jgi:uncharacterized protein (TIGR00730 family)
MVKRICVFCGSSNGARPGYVTAAQELGVALANAGVGLVYGGGKVGLMGAVADAAMRAGGEVIGVIPQVLVDKEVGHHGLTELHIVKSMHERKAMMEDLSEGFIAMPGGFGTLEEFCEILTWAQLGFHRKPCGILNVDGYYDAMLAFFDYTVTEGFVRPINRAAIVVENTPTNMVSTILTYQPPIVDKWVTREEQL